MWSPTDTTTYPASQEDEMLVVYAEEGEIRIVLDSNTGEMIFQESWCDSGRFVQWGD